MHVNIAHERAQRLLRQRNWLTLGLAGMTIVSAAMMAAAASSDREIVLVPITSDQTLLTSAGVTPEYLELVTRDTALMLLNRSPESLDYWMDQILKLAAPQEHGKLKAELVKIVSEQRGSDIAQAFVIRSLEVNPESLSSTVTGTLKTYVGAQVISSEQRQFSFRWSYSGLSLRLTGFSQLSAHPGDKDR